MEEEELRKKVRSLRDTGCYQPHPDLSDPDVVCNVSPPRNLKQLPFYEMIYEPLPAVNENALRFLKRFDKDHNSIRIDFFNEDNAGKIILESDPFKINQYHDMLVDSRIIDETPAKKRSNISL